MVLHKIITPETLTKLDLRCNNSLRRKISEEIGVRISTVYAWGSQCRDIPKRHEQSVCNVINTHRSSKNDINL